MDAYTAIRSALLPIAEENGWPLEPEIYDGDSERYIVYNYADNRGAEFGDDRPACNLADVQVHFYAPAASKDKRKKLDYEPYASQIRDALFQNGQNGFTYPAMRPRVDRDEDRQADVWHVAFECEYIEN